MERLIILLIPLLVVLVPAFNFLPKLLAWRVHSRVHRPFGELALFERDVGKRTGTLPIEKWVGTLDRIEHAAAHTPGAGKFRQRGLYIVGAHRAGPPRRDGEGAKRHSNA